MTQVEPASLLVQPWEPRHRPDLQTLGAIAAAQPLGEVRIHLPEGGSWSQESSPLIFPQVREMKRKQKQL